MESPFDSVKHQRGIVEVPGGQPDHRPAMRPQQHVALAIADKRFQVLTVVGEAIQFDREMMVREGRIETEGAAGNGADQLQHIVAIICGRPPPVPLGQQRIKASAVVVGPTLLPSCG